MKHLRIVYATMALGAVALGVVPAAQAQVVAVAQDSPYRLGIIGVERTEIGVSIRDVEEGDASNEGAVITEVGERSPADEAGLRSGDILVEFDGERVRSAQHLARLVQETPAGRTVNGICAVARSGPERKLVRMSSPMARSAPWSPPPTAPLPSSPPSPPPKGLPAPAPTVAYPKLLNCLIFLASSSSLMVTIPPSPLIMCLEL